MPFPSDGPPVLPHIPGTPYSPSEVPTSDAGIGGGNPLPPWLQAFFRAITGGGQPIDAFPAVGVPSGGGPMVKVPGPNSSDPPGGVPGTGSGGLLGGIADQIHAGIADLENGLPIFGTFALLSVLFVVGLVMFLEESGGGEQGRKLARTVAAVVK